MSEVGEGAGGVPFYWARPEERGRERESSPLVGDLTREKIVSSKVKENTTPSEVLTKGFDEGRGIVLEAGARGPSSKSLVFRQALEAPAS